MERSRSRNPRMGEMPRQRAASGASGASLRGAPGRPAEKPHHSVVRRIRKQFKLFPVRSGLDMPFLFLTLISVSIGLVMMLSLIHI